MLKNILYCLFIISIFGFSLEAQSFKVLHYSETSGFDHNTRANALAMLNALGAQHNFMVDDDQTGAAFDTLTNLQQYAVVVFSNTSGNTILDSTQRANFEQYINNGGALMGIHAASDTYRHSTANGGKTGTWDWYAETMGGSVQESPNHTASRYNGIIDVIGTHTTTNNVPNPWNKVEEYYYWENGYLNDSIVSVLEVRNTGPNSYDTVRPVSWYQNLLGGGRTFYTSLGHANSNYTADTSFQNHIRDAVLWASGNALSLNYALRKAPSVFPNPTTNVCTLSLDILAGSNVYVSILDLDGNVYLRKQITLQAGENNVPFDLKALPPSIYVLNVQMGLREVNVKVVKQ